MPPPLLPILQTLLDHHLLTAAEALELDWFCNSEPAVMRCCPPELVRKASQAMYLLTLEPEGMPMH